jgi:L-fucose mutarotase/ribose pyranase (RbsD/FucU family)
VRISRWPKTSPPSHFRIEGTSMHCPTNFCCWLRAIVADVRSICNLQSRPIRLALLGKRSRSFLALGLSLLVSTPLLQAAPDDWRALLNHELPLLGHRNWIVVVDSAYPLQTSPGVETVETGASQDEVVRAVLNDLSLTKHVAPVVYMDAELPFVSEKNAPGVTQYRTQLQSMLHSLQVHSLPHEQIIKMLGETGNTFHVLILKTTLTVPYTSVFLRLDCKYWDDASEQELRNTMRKHTTHRKARASQ